MYSTHNDGNSVAPERFIRILKSKVFNCMTLISKNKFVGKLDDTVKKYNNTYHSWIKIRPVNIKSSTER